jgi:hypothetical protein
VVDEICVFRLLGVSLHRDSFVTDVFDFIDAASAFGALPRMAWQSIFVRMDATDYAARVLIADALRRPERLRA